MVDRIKQVTNPVELRHLARIKAYLKNAFDYYSWLSHQNALLSIRPKEEFIVICSGKEIGELTVHGILPGPKELSKETLRKIERDIQSKGVSHELDRLIYTHGYQDMSSRLNCSFRFNKSNKKFGDKLYNIQLLRVFPDFIERGSDLFQEEDLIGSGVDFDLDLAGYTIFIDGKEIKEKDIKSGQAVLPVPDFCLSARHDFLPRHIQYLKDILDDPKQGIKFTLVRKS